jgi:hypothetical protein
MGGKAMNELLLRRRVAASKSLPYDAEIEYLESDGTQWIDTGIIPSSDIRLYIDGLFPTLSNNALIHGVIDQVGSTYRRFHIGFSSNRWQGGVGTAVAGNGSANTSRHIFQISGLGYAYVDSITMRCNSTAFPSISIYLFARNFNGEASNTGFFRLFSSNIYSYSQDKMLADFIPVRLGQVGYLYDKVSGQLFGNAGTGDFILGPDKN